jgi:hypothetical protein
LRELHWMAEGRGNFDWEQTSLQAAIAINANRDPAKSRPVHPADLNPYATKRPPATVPASIECLKIFVQSRER